ncbi:UNVERIFIED_CONTAM: hypothetical protein Scaly_1784000 [Sesamum calycinum]|uniref:Uncharacterized protein n=1 Tax=Sesamum calycinum TaxID=2727403 RepID=A0AAW2NXL1_9LAMI
MSVVSFLLLLILCFSFHACNARILRAAVSSDLTKEFQCSSSKKNEEKLNPGSSSSTKPDGKNLVRDAPRRVLMEVDKMNGGYDHAAGNRHFKGKSDRVKGSEGGESESLSSVSRRAAHRKSGGKEPGFNLDYLPPRTHPPVHN